MKNHKIIKIYNELFNYNLKTSSFKVYIYLSTFFWWKKSACVKLQTIADRCNISINTAQRAINELTSKELITKCICHKDHRRTTNIYTVTKLSGKYTIIERSMFYQNIDNSAFKIYCAIAMRKNHAGKAFPSLSTLQEDSQLSKNTVIEKVQILNDSGYILKSQYINKTGCFGNNNHTVLNLTVRAALLWLISKAEAMRKVICNCFIMLISSFLQEVKKVIKRIKYNSIVLLFCRIISLFFIPISFLYNRSFSVKNTS